jgi:N-acetylneuraminate synthase
MRTVKTILNDPRRIFIIAEAGSNWKVGSYKDDLRRAEKLIKVAAECGADAIKFQTYNARGVYVSNAGKSKYLSKSRITKTITEIFDEYAMPYKMLKILSSYCRKQNILFMSTPFSIRDARAVDKYVSIHKIASYEINHIPLLKFLAKTKKPIIISSGASTNKEIEFAIKTLKKNGAKQIALLQCTAKYPAPLESMNLSVIPKFKKKYSIPVGLSDHSIDPLVAPLTAIGFGATILEKHFTVDKHLDGPDHFFALEPTELKNMIRSVRAAEKTVGSGEKKILPDETELRRFAVRSVQATMPIHKGDVFRLGQNMEILRPGNQKRGAEARFVLSIEGKKSRRNIRNGEGITLRDCVS